MLCTTPTPLTELKREIEAKAKREGVTDQVTIKRTQDGLFVKYPGFEDCTYCKR